MKSSYRRFPYESTPYKIDTVETSLVTTYRGNHYAIRRPLNSPHPATLI